MLFRKNIDYAPQSPISDWRKITIGTWRKIGDPSVYGFTEFRVDKVLTELERLSKSCGTRITITHFIGKCVAETLRRHPELNSIVRFGSVRERKKVSIFFQAAHDPSGKDLSGLVIRDADQKNLVTIAREMDAALAHLRANGDRQTYPIKTFLGKLPDFLLARFLWLSGFMSYQLNLWSPLFGTPQDTFGSIMVTNVGALGLDFGFAPLVPYSHCPCVITVGAVKDRPVVESGSVVVGKTIRICFTFDHRLIDGLQASRIAATLTSLFENPEEIFNA
jgi:pyruvate/2-oxoglutarate dehydrogenase complex dihydrolipoamide acyltransferase (E2) component